MQAKNVKFDASKGVAVIGAGLAGCEAAWQIARRGVHVTLYEMKPYKYSDAHHSDGFAELVCSNSFRAARLQNAVGLLKEEMRRMDSLIMTAADASAVPAGGALAVDRQLFSEKVTEAVRSHPLILVVEEERGVVPQAALRGEEITIIATGPLTSDPMADSIQKLLGDGLYFFDAAAPIVAADSLDFNKVFAASRYGKGGDDYLNAPMDRDEYFAFVEALLGAEAVQLKDFESSQVFEGCMPVETMAVRGEMTLAFGPLKPVGLSDPRTGKRPFAVVQLRKEDMAGSHYNLVGFQTHLTFPEQRRVFRMIPGLENAEFTRYGVMHRNTFIHSPGKLNGNYQVIEYPQLFFAGQMTGVEGYVESAASGLVAGISAARLARGMALPSFLPITAHGALSRYISSYKGKDFQPMNVSFGLIDELGHRVRSKQERYSQLADRALAAIEDLKSDGILA